ncbi:MAG: type II toxin-antitoxin system HicA family toxin [Candidatus Paceibacterota bacterium]
MPHKLKRLSGRDVVKILESFGFGVEKQRGSHIKLSRQGPNGEKQVLGVPNHKTLVRGTCKGIFDQASHYVSSAELAPHFYDE